MRQYRPTIDIELEWVIKYRPGAGTLAHFILKDRRSAIHNRLSLELGQLLGWADG